MLFPRYFLLVFSILPALLYGQKGDDRILIDSTIQDVKRVMIGGARYTGIIKQDSFFLRDKKGHNLLKLPNDYFSFEFKDFNEDGYMDLWLERAGNTPEIFDLFVFMPAIHSFQKIKGFDKFPAPLRIKGTPYFYSYHKSGCADLDWESDLFFIHNDAAVALGNISGRGCDRDEKGVYIYKIHSNKRQLVRRLPIKIIYTHKDLKWGFIEAYWKKYYKRFI